MTTREMMRTVTDAMKNNGASGDDIARAELVIQYFGNAEFRDRLNDFVFESTYHKN